MEQTALRLAILAATLGTLSACGGGTDSDSTTDTTATPIAITSENAVSISQEVLANRELALSTDAQLPIGVELHSQAVATLDYPDLLQLAIAPALSPRPAAAVYPAGVEVTHTLDECVSGSGTITITSANPPASSATYEPAPGDRIVLRLAQCVIAQDDSSLNLTLNGEARVTMQEPGTLPPTGFPTDPAWEEWEPLAFDDQRRAWVVYDDYSVTLTGAQGNGMNVRFNGDITLQSGETDDQRLRYGAIEGSISFILSGNDSAQSASFGMHNAHIEGLSRIDAANGHEYAELRHDVTYSSNRLGGRGGQVTIDTQQNLVHDAASGKPLSSGVVKLIGARNSSVLITIPSPSGYDVRLAVDEDGNGSIDSVLDRNWNAQGELSE